MRLLDAAFDVLRRAGEPLSPAEIVRQIKSASIQIDANEPLNDEAVKVELEHFASGGNESSGIIQTPSGRFTLPSMLDKTIRTDTSIATTAASTINAISIADANRRSVSEVNDHTILRRIRALTNQRFERFNVVFLASLGMTDIKVINLRPGELDIHASVSVASVMEVNFLVQALNWRRDVHGGDVQLLRGGMRIGDQGLIITTSEFQQGAFEEATRKNAIPIATINGPELVKIAKERGVVTVLG